MGQLLYLCVSACIVSSTAAMAGLTQVKPSSAPPVAAPLSTPTVSTQSAETGNYLTRTAGSAFRTTIPFTKTKIEVSENGGWVLRSPHDRPYLVVPDGTGGFQFWGTNKLGGRYDGTGFVGVRGIRVCSRGVCSVWLTAADGRPYFLSFGHGKQPAEFYGAYPLFSASGSDEEWKRWKPAATELQHRLREPEGVTALLGFPLNNINMLADIDNWIAGLPVTVTTPMAVAARQAPLSGGADSSGAANGVYTRRTAVQRKKKGGFSLGKLLWGDGSTPYSYTPAPNPLFSGGSSSTTLPDGSTYTWSPQGQAELDRFKAAEQVNGGGRGSGGGASSGTVQPYAKANDQLARDRAATDARRSDLSVQTEASRAAEARAFAASPAANQGNAISGSGSGASSGSLIVRSADPGEGQRIAAQEAERQRYLAGEADRLAKARAEAAAAKANYERAQAEVARQDAELARNRDCILPKERRPAHCPTYSDTPKKARQE